MGATGIQGTAGLQGITGATGATGATAATLFLGNFRGNLGANSTQFTPVSGLSQGEAAVDAAQQLSGMSCTTVRMRAQISVVGLTTNTFVATFLKNGAPTVPSVACQTPVASADGTICDSGVQTVTLVPNDRLALQLSNVGAGTAIRPTWTITCNP